MANMGRILILFLGISFLCSNLYARETYSQVRIPIADFTAWQKLSRLGLSLEEGVQIRNREIEMIVNAEEWQRLHENGFLPIVVRTDMESYFSSRLAAQGNTDSFATGKMGGFHTFQEAITLLSGLRKKYKSLISMPYEIGTSVQGRPILAYRISDNAEIDEPEEPEVLYTALHHAREPQSLMTLLYFMQKLLQGYGKNSEVTYLINNRQLWFVPVVNPDGYVFNQEMNPAGGGLWRKNRRSNADGPFGIDLNRNYGYKWAHDDTGSSPRPADETFRGPAAFSEPEIAALRDFVRSNRFLLTLNYHSFRNFWIYPWGYTNIETMHKLIFREYGRWMTQDNGYIAGTTSETLGYFANGEADDWLYGDTQQGKSRILAMTPEVGGFSDSFWPKRSRILPLAVENYNANLALAWLAGGYVVLKEFSASELSGNGNGSLEPGEQASFRIMLRNMGWKNTVKAISASLSTENKFAFVETTNETFGNIQPFRNIARNYVVRIDNKAPLNKKIPFELTLSSQGELLRKEFFELTLGRVVSGTKE